jgi:hypothetical protein
MKALMMTILSTGSMTRPFPAFIMAWQSPI